MEKGLEQRVTALNRFLHDIYHEQEIVKPASCPREQIEGNARSSARDGRRGPAGRHLRAYPGHRHRARAGAGGSGEAEYYVLEDNLRVPSGVSYMLEDRKMMMRLFPELFTENRVAPVAHYPRPAARDAALGLS